MDDGTDESRIDGRWFVGGHARLPGEFRRQRSRVCGGGDVSGADRLDQRFDVDDGRRGHSRTAVLVDRGRPWTASVRLGHGKQVDASGLWPPLHLTNAGGRPRERVLQRRWEHLAKAARSGPETPIFEYGSQVESLASAGDRDIEQPFRLLAVAFAQRVVCIGQAAADRNQLPPARAGRNDDDGIAVAAGAAVEVGHEHDREFEPLRGVHRHQVHRVERIHHRVRLVASGQSRQVFGHARHRGVAVVLQPTCHGADLLQVLPRLRKPRPAKLERIGCVGDDAVEELRRRHAVHQRQPHGERRAKLVQHGAVLCRQALGRRLGARQDGLHARRDQADGPVRQPHEPGSQQRGAAQRRGRLREIPEQRHQVFHFVRIEEAEALVNVRRNPA